MKSPLHVSIMLLVIIAAGGSSLAQSGNASFISRLKDAPFRIEGTHRNNLDPSQVRMERNWKGDLCKSRLTNVGAQPVRIGNIILFDLASHGLPAETPIYGEGFQMLSQTGGTIAHPAAIGAFEDAKHYKIPQPDNLPTVYGMMTFDLGHTQVLLGFTSCRKFIGRFSFSDASLSVSVDPEDLELQPGESWQLEDFTAVAGVNQSDLLAGFATNIEHNHPSLLWPAVINRTGWCTWYGVGGAGNQKIVTESAAHLAASSPGIKFLQIDEGFSNKLGDWLDINPAFGDMDKTIAAIRANGFLPGLWFAPFIAQANSQTLASHPDWYIQGPDNKPLDSSSIGYGGWSHGPWRVLDATNPSAQNYLKTVFHTMRQKYGVTYFKLDANYWGAIRGGKRFDPKATRIEAYRRGMEAIRRGAGSDAIILGCNAPIWPSFGEVNVMRVTNDVSRDWKSFSSIGRENFHRAWQNNQLWVNDPDCVVLGGANLPQNLWLFHATVIHAVGGMVLSGDKIENLKDDQQAIFNKLVPPTGKCARFDNDRYEAGVTDLDNRQFYYAFNWDNASAGRTIHLLRQSRLRDYWTDQDLGVHQGDFSLGSLPGESARLILATPVITAP